MKTRLFFLCYAGLALALFAGGMVFGYLTHRNEWIPMAARNQVREVLGVTTEVPDDTLFEGAYVRAQWAPVEESSIPDETLAQLGAIGYVDGSVPASAQRGITLYDANAAFDGANLVVSAHAPEAKLVAMDGTVLHTWHKPSEDVWPGLEVPPYVLPVSTQYWRRAHVFPNGDMLVIFEGLGLIKIDRDSNVLWAVQGGFHHHLNVMREGRIHILGREARVLPRFNPRDAILEDFLVTLDADGNELSRVSLIECFENSDYASLLDLMPRYGDVFHTNTLQVLDGAHAETNPAFAAGNVLVSIWKLNTIAVVDPREERVVWAITGMWSKQHEPELLANGHILVYDNQGGANTSSRILEIDPQTQAVVWSYAGTPDAPFYSELCGAVQRLPNGNTLITESYKGRAFEVTPDGRVVWEYYNPHRAGPDDAYIANLFEVRRVTGIETMNR